MLNIKENVKDNYPDYLRDESRSEGTADYISFPATQDEVKDAVLWSCDNDYRITIQGGLTGITGGAVPAGGHIINLSHLSAISDIKRNESGEPFLTVEPGALLSDINKKIENLSDGKLFFPPDPTEKSASIGGMISCNASGARSFLYGATRKYILRLKIILADGGVIDIKRGELIAAGRECSIKDGSGRVIEFELPECEMPETKNASGYYIKENMDLIDLFIGAEGTLGIITEADIALVESPGAIWGAQLFFPDMESSLGFVDAVRDLNPENCDIAAIEFIDGNALDLLRETKKKNPAFSAIPHLADNWGSSVYVEFHGGNDEVIEDAVLMMSELMGEYGGNDEDAWLASGGHEMENLKLFRHAVPEVVNMTIDERRKKEPGLTKLGTDLAVPGEYLRAIMTLYKDDLSANNLDFVIFGHIGDNHVHVNIIPANKDEYLSGKKLYLKWAEYAVSVGGTVSAEHGIGKLKKEMLKVLYNEDILAGMRKIKLSFDSDNRLNPDNLF